MSKKKVLVCGATGFIGRNIAENFSLRSEYEVYGTYLDTNPFDNPKIKMFKVDLRDPIQVDNIVRGKDIIIQAAATTSGAKDIITKPYCHVTDNAVINSLIFRSAYETNISHVIFFSCTVMYQSSDVPIKESDFNANQGIYPNYFGVGWTKVYLEKMCEFYSRIGDTKFTVLRHSNVYGPYDKFDLEHSHVFGATMTKVMMTPHGGQIVVWGTGEEERDLIHVSDVVDFVERALRMQQDRFDLVNVGAGKAIAVRDLVRKMITLSGKELSLQHDTSKPTIKTSLFLDISRARERYGWEPKISLDEGIRKTMAWYRDHIDMTKLELK